MVQIEAIIRHFGFWLAYGDVRAAGLVFGVGAIVGWWLRSIDARRQMAVLEERVRELSRRSGPTTVTMGDNVRSHESIRRLFRRNDDEPLLVILAKHERGIYKRIDENRELLELLQAEASDFLRKHMWVEGWLESQDRFLTDLESASRGRGDVVNNFEDSGHFPRPWPGSRRMAVTIEPIRRGT